MVPSRIWLSGGGIFSPHEYTGKHKRSKSTRSHLNPQLAALLNLFACVTDAWSGRGEGGGGTMLTRRDENIHKVIDSRNPIDQHCVFSCCHLFNSRMFMCRLINLFAPSVSIARPLLSFPSQYLSNLSERKRENRQTYIIKPVEEHNANQLCLVKPLSAFIPI